MATPKSGGTRSLPVKVVRDYVKLGKALAKLRRDEGVKARADRQGDSTGSRMAAIDMQFDQFEIAKDEKRLARDQGHPLTAQQLALIAKAKKP